MKVTTKMPEPHVRLELRENAGTVIVCAVWESNNQVYFQDLLQFSNGEFISATRIALNMSTNPPFDVDETNRLRFTN